MTERKIPFTRSAVLAQMDRFKLTKEEDALVQWAMTTFNIPRHQIKAVGKNFVICADIPA